MPATRKYTEMVNESLSESTGQLSCDFVATAIGGTSFPFGLLLCRGRQKQQRAEMVKSLGTDPKWGRPHFAVFIFVLGESMISLGHAVDKMSGTSRPSKPLCLKQETPIHLKRLAAF
jgi:hypothetical protein